MTPLQKYIEADKDRANAFKARDEAEQEFMESLMGSTTEEALAMFEILKRRLDRAHNIFRDKMRYVDNLKKEMEKQKAVDDAHTEARKTFFGRAYDVLFGRKV